ncbi:MAG TPA: alanine racemase [Gallionellaceae bacterium]
MSRPITARIDLSALHHNLQVARRSTSARIMAVIKADAYGHGLLRCAEALAGADGFALLDLRDALRLREAGYRQTILLLEGAFSPDDLPRIAGHKLDCVIHSPHQLAMLEGGARLGNKISAWLKVNTGMNRLGFMPQDLSAAMEKLKSIPSVRDITLMTHFSHADEAAGVTAQLQMFNDLAAPYRTARSLANSAALLRFPQTHADWVRPGIMLYGASPFAETSAQALGIKPVMTLQTEIISVRELRAGECIGYGGTFCADRPMRIGVAACGYADGYPRHASTGTPVLVNGVRARTLGRVSMDMLCVDLSALPDAGVGSRVTLWGEGLPVEEVAAAAGTISYEMLCAVTARVPVITA